MYKNIVRLLIAVMCLCISIPVYAANRAVITEGWYKIVPAHAQSKALDVGGAKTNPGANIQLWGYVGAPQQKFYVRHRGDNWYSIKAGNCDLYVDAQGGVPHNGENVHLWNWNGTDAQLWGFIDTGDGFNIVTKMQSNLVFDATGAGRSDGTNVQLWTRENVAWHRWILIPVEAPGSNTSSGESYVVSTNSASLLLRNGPGSGYGIKARMPRGSVVTVYSIQNGWAEVSYNGIRGYASASYLARKSNSQANNTGNSVTTNSSYGSNENAVLNRINSMYGWNGFRLNAKYIGKGECRGFAKKVYKSLFYVGDVTGYTSDNFGASSYPSSYIVGSVRNFDSNDIASVRNLFNKAKPGAFVQMGRRGKLNNSGTAAAPHSAILVSVDGNGVIFYEANADGKRTIQRNYYTWNQLAEKNKGFTIYLPNSYTLK